MSNLCTVHKLTNSQPDHIRFQLSLLSLFVFRQLKIMQLLVLFVLLLHCFAHTILVHSRFRQISIISRSNVKILQQ